MRIALRWRLVTRVPEAITALAWVPVLIAAVYAVLFLARLPGLVHAVYLSADVASAPYLGALYAGAPAGAHVVLGNIAWFPALFFELATRGFPGHRQLSGTRCPYALSLAGVGTVAWCAGRVAGRWAGATVRRHLFAASPALRSAGVRREYIHVCGGYAVVAALGAFLVGCVRSGGQIGSRSGSCCTCRGPVALSEPSASPPMTSSQWRGSMPLLASVIADHLVVTARNAVASLRRLAASWPSRSSGSVAIDHVVADANIAPAPFTVLLAGLDKIVSHLQLLAQGFAYTFYGDSAGSLPPFCPASSSPAHSWC